LTTTVALLPNGRQQFFDGNGQPLVGGQVFTYIPGGFTPKTSYSDYAGVIPNTNPITLDSLGSAAIWGPGYYRQIVNDSLENLIWDQVTLATASGGSGGGVISVDVSGGTTGLITSGGPITTSGTITLAGTLELVNGGTGENTAAAAFNALSPITSIGDLIVGNGTNRATRLGVGGTGDVLLISGGVPAWGSVSGTGTVTSVAVSGGTTGFTTSGGPITGSGTITIGGHLLGTTTNDDAAAGYVGEYISETRAFGSAVSLTSTVAADVASISLTAGDWDVNGNVGFAGSSSAAINAITWISTVSATRPSPPNAGGYNSSAPNSSSVSGLVIITGTIRLSLATTTTVYLGAYSNFGSGTVTSYGFIGARRAR
jgi:hypothetical protein